MNPLLNYSGSAGLFLQGASIAGAANQGNVFYVRPRTGSDGQDGRTPLTAFKTLATALGACTANQNDIVYLMAESNTAANTTDYQASTLTWSKDGVHLIGVNCGVMIGQRSRIAQLSTVKTIENLVVVSANNCLIANLEIFQGVASSTATSPVALTVSGQRNHVVNCQISGNGDTGGSTDTAGARSLVVSGSENLFEHCYIGLDTVLRATQTAEVGLTSTNTRNVFERCHFETYSSLSTFKMISVSTTTDRFFKLLDCDFVAVQNITSAVAPTGAIGITTMNGQGIVKNPYVYGFDNIVTADNAYVQVLGYDGTATGHLIGIAQGVDAA